MKSTWKVNSLLLYFHICHLRDYFTLVSLFDILLLKWNVLRLAEGGSMMDSMYNSLLTSMSHVKEDCLRAAEKEQKPAVGQSGLHSLASAIDSSEKTFMNFSKLFWISLLSSFSNEVHYSSCFSQPFLLKRHLRFIILMVANREIRLIYRNVIFKSITSLSIIRSYVLENLIFDFRPTSENLVFHKHAKHRWQVWLLLYERQNDSPCYIRVKLSTCNMTD